MILKRGRHIHEVRKGMWAFFLDADWLGRQTPVTWVAVGLVFSIMEFL